jgi:hypothetical protein
VAQYSVSQIELVNCGSRTYQQRSRFALDIGFSTLLCVQAEKGPVKKKQHLAAGENGKHVSIHTVPAAVENECKILSVSEEDLPPTPEDEKEAIKQKFLVEMPEDFYSFWSFCKALLPDKPEGIVLFFSCKFVNLKLPSYKVCHNCFV